MKKLFIKNRLFYLLIALSLIAGTSSLMAVESKAGDFYDCCKDGHGTGTPGYWKNHPDAWPVEGGTIGGTFYDKWQAIEIMETAGKGDKCFTLFNALVAAALNVRAGNCSWCIGYVIDAADMWMTEFCSDFDNDNINTVTGSDWAWQKWGERMYWKLDSYNNGELCAPSRD